MSISIRYGKNGKMHISTRYGKNAKIGKCPFQLKCHPQADCQMGIIIFFNFLSLTVIIMNNLGKF